MLCFDVSVEQKFVQWLSQCCWRTYRSRRPGSPLHFTSQSLSWWDLRSHFSAQFMFDDFIDFPFPPLSASLSIPLSISLASFSPLRSAIPYWLKCTYSCILPLPFPSAGCYRLPFSNSANNSVKNWRPFLFITIYHNMVRSVKYATSIWPAKNVPPHRRGKGHKVLHLHSVEVIRSFFPPLKHELKHRGERFVLCNIIWLKINCLLQFCAL